MMLIVISWVTSPLTNVSLTMYSTPSIWTCQCWDFGTESCMLCSCAQAVLHLHWHGVIRHRVSQWFSEEQQHGLIYHQQGQSTMIVFIHKDNWVVVACMQKGDNIPQANEHEHTLQHSSSLQCLCVTWGILRSVSWQIMPIRCLTTFLYP